VIFRKENQLFYAKTSEFTVNRSYLISEPFNYISDFMLRRLICFPVVESHNPSFVAKQEPHVLLLKQDYLFYDHTF